jgi:hypothetical protein
MPKYCRVEACSLQGRRLVIVMKKLKYDVRTTSKVINKLHKP